MSKLYLQNIVDDISFENLPAKWQGFFTRDGEDGTKVDIRDSDYKFIKPLIWWE